MAGATSKDVIATILGARLSTVIYITWQGRNGHVANTWYRRVCVGREVINKIDFTIELCLIFRHALETLGNILSVEYYIIVLLH